MRKVIAYILIAPALLLAVIAISAFATGEIGAGIVGAVFTAPVVVVIVKLLMHKPSAKLEDAPKPKPATGAKSAAAPKPVRRDDVKSALEGITACTVYPSEIVEPRKPASSMPEIKYKNLTKRSHRERFERFVAIDTETTGLSAAKCDIIEVAAVRFVNSHPVEIFHTYCRPRGPIPAQASKINGITDDDVKECPPFGTIAAQLHDFIGDDIMVAHNADFDMKFLHCGGFDLSGRKESVYDTLQLSRFKFKDDDGYRLGSYKLGDICSYVGIHTEDLHSALTDATACGLLFVEILNEVFE